ncbi:hypothetical protein A3742_15975 [Oleiphilus sp. HI0071]|nr:hypothetical protein A3737_16165 [Oleiphilus sp. HI0065]KZY87930.1 hypothetical protein A3742_15975 [Oleiphilus sp. HI0071]KZZ06095.1 hypothetical protein A3744_07400 [Oleiphilus sp. HI0073]KZZ12988.1 hypothetical protein A3750_04710 [Oleiphilus sp. HI0079]KZZ16993.1 hypothetical protein A3751_13055 [Oleiphilus sp. HI0080]KZZ40186.1 hypothetical protein A3758_09965 [Oleiphilus sp. HI0118]KZZ51908.1 hypothetical protein A3760_11120 [Oleiphilus sp. HI0122]KZZ64221.1 hypothetical protein A37
MLASHTAWADLIIDERHHKAVHILTSPSTAIIYLNGNKLGESPLDIDIEQLTGLSNRITALPMHPHQFRQEINLSKGSLPEQLKIFMDIDTRDRNQQADDASKREEQIASGDDVIACKGNEHIQTLYFDTNKHRISDAQRTHLESLSCDLLQREVLPSINVYGQADPRGTREYNVELSLKRAISVKEALTQSGYPSALVTPFAYGATQLRDQNNRTLPHEKNRRTYLEIHYNE